MLVSIPPLPRSARSRRGMVNDPVRGNNLPFGPPASGRQVELTSMIRTAEWKLVHTPGREINELYHLTTDPWELHNVYAASERNGPVVADLLHASRLPMRLARR